MNRYYYSFLCVLIFLGYTAYAQDPIVIGAERFDQYLPKIANKKVGMVVNHTSVVGTSHLVDTLLAKGANITAVYAPEHGYKGNVERGMSISTYKDPDTGLTIYSIYGSRRKPTPEELKDVELMIFDMQDVGARFFTYISTLHYIMEACAESNIPLLLLDRPNPIGYYVDGPVLDPTYKSFIGMHPVALVHGMTIGEYGQMINGEGWLKNGLKCKLEVVKVDNYNHRSLYQVPVGPSPNLPDMRSVYLYPSICLFEGTEVNEGRGTEKPFQLFGTPDYSPKTFQFIPKSLPGFTQNPKFESQVCFGYNLSETAMDELQAINRLDLKYLLEFYSKSKNKERFFLNTFNLLAGTDKLQKQIAAGKSEAEIRESWQQGLKEFKITRQKYLLYAE